VLDGTFLEGTDAHKGSWRDERDASLEKKGISPRYYWTGKGRDALEVAYETAAGFAAAATVREVWKRRHGRAAAPLLLVVAYAANGTQRATVCGPAGEDPRVVALDFDRLVVYFVVPLGYGVFAVRQLRIAGGAPPSPSPFTDVVADRPRRPGRHHAYLGDCALFGAADNGWAVAVGADTPDGPSSRGLAHRSRRYRGTYVLGERLRARLRGDGRLFCVWRTPTARAGTIWCCYRGLERGGRMDIFAIHTQHIRCWTVWLV
jgi:hypothetical protein